MDDNKAIYCLFDKPLVIFPLLHIYFLINSFTTGSDPCFPSVQYHADPLPEDFLSVTECFYAPPVAPVHSLTLFPPTIVHTSSVYPVNMPREFVILPGKRIGEVRLSSFTLASSLIAN